MNLSEYQLELLSAYLDGEVSEEEARQADALLSENDEAIQWWGRQIETRCLLQKTSSPLGEEFIQQTIAKIELSSPSISPAPRSSASWKQVVIWGVSLAAVLFLAFYFTPRGPFQQNNHHPDLVEKSSPPQPKRPQSPPPQPEPPRLFVNFNRAMMRNLLLVYEVALACPGKELPVFPNLLQRHNIGWGGVTVLKADEQQELVDSRLLKGVVLDEEAKNGKVELVLLRCTGNQADSMWLDLKGKGKEEISSYFINLASRNNQAKALNRICEKHQTPKAMGQAIRLLGNFAIMNSEFRTTAATGVIRQIDPVLLEKATEPVSDQDKHRAEAGEFPCELLFVIRHPAEQAAYP